MRINLSKILGFNAGYVDTASFLGIHGLFAAHVTGNFVTLGAALTSGNQNGAWAKLLALPMFCLVVFSVKLIDRSYLKASKSSYNFLLKLMFFLFTVAAVISIEYLPFPQTDTWPSFIVGMLLVAAMSIQNAVHRLHWTKEAPTTVMTGSTTQMMLDAADWFSQPSEEKKEQIRKRFSTVLPTMLSFALGCAVAALVYKFALIWLFVIPPVLMLASYWKKEDYIKN
ncbi:YoaK family protein [Acinetobacter oleivorans]|uniref:YoaK family protein n=1 Tax=Acinetobacter oleivorans TaxID=1148157 RepID=UPI001CD406D3|nr:YoaK family protein [Acinetobacter oleivorans]